MPVYWKCSWDFQIFLKHGITICSICCSLFLSAGSFCGFLDFTLVFWTDSWNLNSSCVPFAQCPVWPIFHQVFRWSYIYLLFLVIPKIMVICSLKWIFYLLRHSVLRHCFNVPSLAHWQMLKIADSDVRLITSFQNMWGFVHCSYFSQINGAAVLLMQKLLNSTVYKMERC